MANYLLLDSTWLDKDGWSVGSALLLHESLHNGYKHVMYIYLERRVLHQKCKEKYINVQQVLNVGLI